MAARIGGGRRRAAANNKGRNAGGENRSGAESRSGAEEHSGAENRSRAENHAGAEKDTGAENHTGKNAGAWQVEDLTHEDTTTGSCASQNVETPDTGKNAGATFILVLDNGWLLEEKFQS